MRRSVSLALFATLVAAHAQAQVLVPRDGSSPIAVRSQRVEATIDDGLAHTKVRHTFVNPGERPLEAVYVFPLPDGAALTEVAMEVGGKRYEGLLAERKRARRVYDDIVRERRDPALVEQVGRNTFRLSVFPVVPREDTVVELAWIQRVPLTEGAFQYVYALGAGDSSEQPQQDLSLTVRMRSSVPFTSVTASRDDVQVVRPGPREALAALEVRGAKADGDLVVTAAVETREADLAVRTYREATGDGWFLAVVTPPRAREDQLVPRDVTLVIDTSGSMAEDGKLEQAKESALWLLENLRPADRVNVLRFSSDVQAFADAPVPATPERLAELKAFVAGFRPIGSTALGDALRVATVAAAAAGEGRARTVVLLTDGKPTVGETDRTKLVELAKAGGDSGPRVFPFGVGSDVDTALLRGIAAAGRGRAETFRPGGEIVTRLTAFLTRTSSPVIANLALSVDGPAVYDVFPRPLPDAYLGEQVAIVGRYRGAGPGTVTVSASVGSEARSLSATLDFPAAAGGSRSVKQLFAREKLDWLEEARRLRLGLSDDAYYAALDRGAYSTEDEIVREMIVVSVEHGVQCAATAFLVLLPEDRRRLEARRTAALDPEEIEEEEVEEEPILQDLELFDAAAVDAETEDPDMLADSPFDDKAFNDVIGVGGGAGGKYGGRFGGRRNLRAAGGSGSEQVVVDHLEWLKAHQDADGKWDSDGFAAHGPEGAACDGPGASDRDLGATALALLSFLGDGSTTDRGRYQTNVVRGLKWVRGQQDAATGRIGADTGSDSLRDHAVATLVLSEAYYFSKSPLIKGDAQRAVDYLVQARDAHGAWSRRAPDPGSRGDLDADLALTGWAVLALWSAREAGLAVDPDVLTGALAWIEAGTDTPPARASGAALLCRILAGQDPGATPALVELAEAILAATPGRDDGTSSFGLDEWFFRTYAMYQMGGRYWKPWNKATKRILVGALRTDAHAKGSWDPLGPNAARGRVETTATMGLCMEVFFRYARLVR